MNFDQYLLIEREIHRDHFQELKYTEYTPLYRGNNIEFSKFEFFEVEFVVCRS